MQSRRFAAWIPTSRRWSAHSDWFAPAELGYDVTVVRDATADYSDEMMHAALDINLPNCASAIVATKEIVDAILSRRPA